LLRVFTLNILDNIYKVRYFNILCRRELRLVGPTDRKEALDDWIILVEAYMQIQAAADE
jgi:hypothetical protein